MSYPSKEEMIKYINAFTPYETKGKSLDEICQIYLNTFGEHWYDNLKRRIG